MTVSTPEIGAAVRAWRDSLDDAQRAQAAFPFSTDERFAWGYTPVPRRGLALRDMRPSQRAGAMAIVAATMSRRTKLEVAMILALETLLGAPRRLGPRARRRSQRGGAMAIVAATMSRRTNLEVAMIMALETLLGELERA